MATRIGKYKISKRESTMSLVDGCIATDTIKARGYAATKPTIIEKWPAPAASIGTGNKTLTIAQVLTGILEEDPAGASTWTLPTAALAVAGVSGVAIGDCLDFWVINTDGTADVAITIAAGSGGSLVGNAEVESADTTADAISTGSAMFRIRFTGVASGSEAYVVYRLS